MALATTAMMLYGGYKAIKGLGQAAGWWGQAKKLKKSPYQQQYVDYLKRVKEEGMFSPSTRKEMLFQTTQPLQEYANRSKAAISGNIERQGLEGSLINRYAGGNVDRDVLYNVAKTSRDIALKNEMSKHTAPEELYNVGSADELRKYQNRVAYQQARTAGWDEVGSGIQTAIGAMDTGTMFNSPDELLKYLATIEDTKTANLILQMARKAHPEWFGD